MTADRAAQEPAAYDEAGLDELAEQVTIAICLEAFGVLGLTTQALDLAAEAVLATDAIAGTPGEFPRTGGIGGRHGR